MFYKPAYRPVYNCYLSTIAIIQRVSILSGRLSCRQPVSLNIWTSYLSYATASQLPVCTLHDEVTILLWTPAQRKRASVLYFANVFFYPPFASIAKGEVSLFVLLYVCLFVRHRFLDNPRADSRQSSHAGVLWFRTCLLPFWGLAVPGGRKKGQMKFSLLWESMGNFCILAVFERYLSNACTDIHQILFVYGQCLPTCPLPLWDPSAPGGRGRGS